MIDATPSYRCKVSLDNRQGSLHLGFRRYKVEIVEMSRDSFCVRVPSLLARKIAVGSKSKLLYQEMLWSVQCTHKWVGDSNQVDLEFQQLDELSKPKIKKGTFLSKSCQVAAGGQSDPALPVAMLGAFIVTVLVLPAWGGRWGTSDAMCSAVSSTWSTLSDLITARR